jgi:hypothetical protein
MNELAWLVGHSFQSLTRREFDRIFCFDQDIRLVVACLWRLVEDGRIRVTREDDGHQFGLPAPVEAAEEVNRRIALASVVAVGLREGTLDLEWRFETGHTVQIIPVSSGYEAWGLSNRGCQFIAVGGGELATFRADRAGG